MMAVLIVFLIVVGVILAILAIAGGLAHAAGLMTDDAARRFRPAKEGE